jgi:hypothetical protein
MSQNYVYPSSSTINLTAEGTNGATAPTTSVEVSGINPSNNLQPLKTDASGNLLVSIGAAPVGALHVIVDSSALPTGASTSALQTTGNTSLASIDTKLTSPITVTGPLTDAQLRATPVPVSGTVSVSGVATEATLAALSAKTAGALVPQAFNEIALTYIVGGNGDGQIGTAVYKLATVTVRTLTLTYDDSNRLIDVVAS